MSDIGNEMINQGSVFDMTTVIAALITFIAGLLVNWQGSKQFFSTIVSKERMDWIKEMRKLCTELCTICELHDNESELSNEEKTAFLKAKNGMILHLNNTEKENHENQYPIDQKLYELLVNKDFSEIKEKISEIRDNAAIIFKTEWDKVKIEAGNNRLKVKKIQKLQESLKKHK